MMSEEFWVTSCPPQILWGRRAECDNYGKHASNACRQRSFLQAGREKREGGDRRKNRERERDRERERELIFSIIYSSN